MLRKVRRRKKRIYTSTLIITASLILVAIYGANELFSIKNSESPDQPALTAMLPVSMQDPLSLVAQPDVIYVVDNALELHSTNAILLRLDDTGSEVLYEMKSAERVYPASLTKIMTAVTVIENIKNLDEKIVLSEKMYAYLIEENASVAGFVQNESVRAADLLYGAMLPSGAECCIGLAEYISGSETAFADLMNAKAHELGMNDTHFVNTTGLHDDNHYSTVNDMAILLEYALNNETFYEIFTTQQYSSAPTNIHADGVAFYNTMFRLMERIGGIESPEFSNGRILGGKTGYTEEAGQCLASLSEKDGERFMLVTCGAPGDYRTQILHIDDAFYVYNAINYKFIIN